MKRISALTTGPSIDPPSAWVVEPDPPATVSPCADCGEVMVDCFLCDACRPAAIERVKAKTLAANANPAALRLVRSLWWGSFRG